MSRNDILMLSIIKKMPNMEFNKLLKIIYMFQQDKDVKMNFDFDIFLDGPFSSEVLGSVEGMCSRNILKRTLVEKFGHSFTLELTSEGHDFLSSSEFTGLLSETENLLNSVERFVRDASDFDLDLYCKIILLHNNLMKDCGNNLDEKMVVRSAVLSFPEIEETTVENLYKDLFRTGLIDFIKSEEILVEEPL